MNMKKYEYFFKPLIFMWYLIKQNVQFELLKTCVVTKDLPSNENKIVMTF